MSRKTLLESNYNGRPTSYVAEKIISIIASDSKEDETFIVVVGEDEPFYASEPYETIKDKLTQCLSCDDDLGPPPPSEEVENLGPTPPPDIGGLSDPGFLWELPGWINKLLGRGEKIPTGRFSP